MHSRLEAGQPPGFLYVVDEGFFKKNFHLFYFIF
jgi:hypothetical protein